MGDLSKKFFRYEVQCSCGCGASWVSPKLLEKLQHVRDVVNKPMTITSGVRCEAFNSSIKGSLVSSHMPNEDGMGLAVDIACTTSQARYEMVDVAIKFFRRIGIAGEHSGDFIHLDVDPYKTQELFGLLKGVSPSFKPTQESKRFSRGTSREVLMATK